MFEKSYQPSSYPLEDILASYFFHHLYVAPLSMQSGTRMGVLLNLGELSWCPFLLLAW